jgi:hypothetical protein
MTARSMLLTLACLSLPLLPAGCSDDSGPVKDAASKDLSKAKDSAAAEKSASSDLGAPSFSGVIQPLFTSTCASCHSGSSPTGNLDLSSGKAYGDLVNVAAYECSTLKRVLPKDTTNSYLAQKISGAGSCFTGSKMPASGSLDTSGKTAILSWIASGAADN